MLLCLVGCCKDHSGLGLIAIRNPGLGSIQEVLVCCELLGCGGGCTCITAITCKSRKADGTGFGQVKRFSSVYT